MFGGLFTPRAQTPGQPQQQGAGLRGLLDPSVALPMAAALMGNQGNQQNLANAFQMAGPGLQQQAAMRQQAAERNRTAEFLRQKSPDLAMALDAGMPINEAWRSYQEGLKAQKPSTVYSDRAAAAAQYGLDPNTDEGKAFILSGDLPSGRYGSAELSLTPQWGVDADGNPVMLQTSKSGKTVQAELPEGVKLSRDPIKMDAGTHFVLLDPITRQPVGNIPKDLAGAESEKAVGKARGEAEMKFKGAAPGLENSIRLVDEVIDHPSLNDAVGPFQGRMPSISAGARDFDERVEQLKGEAFLAARAELKGGGQITDYEGARAEAALLRASQAKSEKDFKKAMGEFKGALVRGYELLARQAGQTPNLPANAQPVSVGGYTIQQVD